MYFKGKLTASIRAFNKSIRYYEGFPDAYLFKGNAHLYLNEYEDADSCYNKAIELQPDMFIAYLNRGNS